MITQFQGETRPDAIVNHFSLDIVEESSFFAYLDENKVPLNATDEEIEAHYKAWRGQSEPN